MPLKNAKAVLEEADYQLQEIEELYLRSLHNKELPNRLLVKIKNFLENVKSPLDYSANYIFDTCCVQHIDPKKLSTKKRNCVFPIKPTSKDFNETIDSRVFEGLRAEREDIVLLLEKYQPYQHSMIWIGHLNKLVNPNKHIDLSPQTRVQSNHIRTFDKRGRTLSSFPQGAIHIENCVNVTVDGMPWDQVNQVPIPIPGRGVEITSWIGFIFSDLKIPVLPSLKSFHTGVTSIIRDIEDIL